MPYLVIGTAYDPEEKDDDALKTSWLAEDLDYEDAGRRKGFQKKLLFTPL